MKAYSVKKKQADVDRENVKRGFDLALLVTTLALNKIYGFGNVRLSRLEDEISRLVVDEMTSGDVLDSIQKMQQEVERIRQNGDKK